MKDRRHNMRFARACLQALKTFSAAAIVPALLLTFLAQTPAVLAASDAATPKPNIIVILADDYGWGSAGCYGAPAQLKTPHLDRLAREGRRFTNAYAPSSVCSPTRYGLMTGRYDWRTRGDGGGVIGAAAPLQIKTNRLTLASLCKGQGYRTAAFGKWHLGLQAGPGRTDWNKPLAPGPRSIGFDYFFGIAANAWNGPHTFIENETLLGRIPGEDVKVMENYSPTNYTRGIKEQYDTDLLMDEFTNKATDWMEKNSSEPFFMYYAATAVHKPHDYHPRFTGSPFGKYGNFIEELDWCVGQILTQLDRLKLADNTLVIFTSDNGGVVNQRDPEIKYAMDAGLDINGPLRGGKHSEYEGGFREPFLVRWPGKVPAGTVSDQVICLTDILATLASVLDVPLPNGNAEDSFNAWRLFTEENPGPPIRDHVIVHAANSTYAIRMGDWKLIERDAPKQNELYNLREDVAEAKNIHAANADRAAQMQKMLSEARDRGYTRPDAGK
jgi:arylsulfatase A